MANAVGGRIVYGMDEKPRPDGSKVAGAICALIDGGLDESLENIIVTTIQPPPSYRIQGVGFSFRRHHAYCELKRADPSLRGRSIFQWPCTWASRSPGTEIRGSESGKRDRGSSASEPGHSCAQPRCKRLSSLESRGGRSRRRGSASMWRRIFRPDGEKPR